ncbi:unnamed protein product [Alopecurus aequalis]
MVGPRGVRHLNPALSRAVPRPPAVRRLLPSAPAPVGYISSGVPKRKWDGFFPVLSSQVTSTNRKKRRVIHDRFMRRVKDIPVPGYTPSSFIDVIGRITMVSDVIPVQSMHQTTTSNTRTIMLADLKGNELRLVLWGDRAVEFDVEPIRAMGATEPVIAIFVGTLPKMARGIKGLSGSSACRWYVDEDIPDINSFRASLGDKFTPIADYVPTGPDALVPRVQEIPVDKTVKELTDLDPFVDMDKRFFCSVTVARLGSDQRWWFPSCSSCRKTARYNGYQYKCSNDDCTSVHADLTYCVSVIASDGTAEAEFVLFDKVALGAIGRPLIALLRQRYPGRATMEDLAGCARNDVSVPPEITRLVGQKYKLLVCISKKWQVRNSEELSFQVSRIEETYRPELPPPVFGVASESAAVSVSNSATTPQLPVLAQAASPAAHTPPALPRTPVAIVSRISPLTPAPRSSAPLRGARRTLFATLGKEKLQSVVEAADLAEQDAAQAAMDGDLAVVQEKNIETLVPKGDDAAVVADRPGEVVSSGAEGAASVTDKTLEVLPSKNKRVAAAAAAKTQNKKSK